MEPQELLGALSSYGTMSAMLKSRAYPDILSAAAFLAQGTPEALEQYPTCEYARGMTGGAYRFVLRDLLKNVQHYDRLYDRLADAESRRVFANLIGYRILPAQSFLQAAYNGEHPQYFDKSIVSCDENEVFVDCGGRTGGTAEEFVRRFGDYKRLYVYEPSDGNIQACRDNLKKYRNITVRQCGVGERADSRDIPITSLDEDIRTPVTFIKMDIAGFEIPALLGAKRHILEDFPKLAVCAGHILSDLWEIPGLIDAIRPGYRFYLRHYDSTQNRKTVLYAIPPETRMPAAPPSKGRAAKRVAALSPVDGWVNATLLKDCGVIPYLLHKNHGCDAAMVGKKVDEYPNLRYVKGLRLDFLPDGDKEAWLRREAADIDCLLMYGPYPAYYPQAKLYKALNPGGKLVLALDANSYWMDRIQWTEPAFRSFMDQCDVITCAGRTMQRHLNEKWPWSIEYIPNGFYNFSERPWHVDFEKKKNIILTVARLGMPQKATDVLLEAFARIAPQIPDWELHLAGGIDPAFQGWLEAFRERNPPLRERIRYLGNISDRDTLYDTYKRAKIFAMPSVFEGFPNAIPEALYAGNAIAVTKIDEYPDATDDGRCGMASEVGDIDGFAGVLLRLCRSEQLDAMCRRALDYARSVYDMERIVARLYTLIFGGEE